MNLLNLLIEIEENKDIIKTSKKLLKDGSNIGYMKKIKEEFESEKENYKVIEKDLVDIRNKIQQVGKEVGYIKGELQTEQDKLYNSSQYDLRVIQGLEKVIDLKQNEIKKLEEDSLNLLYEEDNISEQKENFRKKLLQLKNSFYEYKEGNSKKITKAKEDIEKAEARISNIEKFVPKELLNEVNEIRSIRGTGAAKISNGVCLGCKMKVSAITLDHIKSNKDIVHCDNCGRIVYCKDSIDK